MDKRRIGAILLAKKLVREADIDQALAFQKEVGGYIGQALLRIGALSEEELLASLSEQLGLPILGQGDMPDDPNAVMEAANALGLPPRWMAAHQAACWFARPETGNYPIELRLAALNPMKIEVREAVEAGLVKVAQSHEQYSAGIPLRSYLVPNALLEQLRAKIVAEADGSITEGDLDTQRLREMAEEAPVIEYVNRIFGASLRDGASDIHIEPYEHSFKVRFRVDGILNLVETQPRGKFNAVASRIKLLSGMDISEQRLPQDGRQTIRFAGETLDLRVSSLPGAWGESLVMRLLRKEASLPDLAGLGLTGRTRQVIDKLLKVQNGIVLVTGPTGSGKSTTLYRCLEEVNDGVRKIITIEDPVEYHMNGITQIQVKADIGYTFARGLRAILRQDPDVIMVGEIRDGETAGIAAQAALTGHLVLSTLHTNSAFAAVERLLDLGLESFLIASAVRGLAAQRLVRRICPHCAQPSNSSTGDQMYRDAQAKGAIFPDAHAPSNWLEPKGCSHCSNTGYRGRLALFEVAAIDDTLRSAIIAKAPQMELLRMAHRQGFLTLMEDGLDKARQGLTSLDEVMRVVGDATEAAAV